MSVMLEEPIPKSDSSSNDSPLPDATALEDKTPEWCRMSAASAGFMLFLGLVLIVFANRPLWHSDLWDHINYGFDILKHRSVSPTEPLLPLAKGMPMVNTAWGSQVIMAKIFQWPKLGLPGLQFAYATLIVLSLGLIGYAVTSRSGSVAFGMLASLVLLFVNWQQLLIIRPQIAGVAMFCGLLTMLSSHVDRRSYAWAVFPVVFAFWANLHGSFSVGLLLMGLFTAGLFMDHWWQTGSFGKAVRCRRFLKLILLIQICAAAALLNPAGLAIYHEVLRVGSHPNITTMYEWDPLTLRMQQGQALALAAVLVAMIVRVSPRRLRFAELIPLLATGAFALWSSRMINWFAPTVAVVIGCHGAAAWRTWRKTVRRTEPYPRTGLWTVVNLGLCWIFFGFTSLGVQAIHGKPAEAKRLLSRETPIQVLEYLKTAKEIPQGLAFMPAEWAGFLNQFGPKQLNPMVNLHVHVIPEEVWTDYVRLQDGPTDWDGLLDRYAINFLIVDKARSRRLIQSIRDSKDYVIDYEDAQAIVARRRQPVP